MRNLLLMFVMLSVCLGMRGQTFAEVDGIFYELSATTSTASVSNGYKAGVTQDVYTGVINIPSTFVYNGVTYTVTGVVQSAFNYSTCTEVTLPPTCTSLGAYSFYSMSALKKLDLGGVNNLPGNAISTCPALNDLYIGCTAGVIGTVGASISSDIRKNINIHVPATLKSQYASSSYWNSVKAILSGNQIQAGDLYYEYYPADKTAMVLAPYEIPGNGNPKQIGPSVEVPGSIIVDGTEYTVTNLQAGVFYDTPNVTAVTFNEGLKNIEFETFYMTKVNEVTFPNSLENLSYNNFYYCTSIGKVTFGTGIKTIGQNTFYKCSQMTELTVLAENPPTLEQGGSGSIFSSDFNKANVILVVPAGSVAAYKATSDWSGFKEYREFGIEPDPTHVVVDGIHYELTDSPYAGEDGVFQCYVESPVTSGLPSGSEYSGIVDIPESINFNGKKFTVTRIGTQSFYMQSDVTEIKIPATVQIIGMQAFQESGITKITLPESLLRIDNYAFRRCTALTSLTALGISPASATSNSFMTITSSCTLYVPHGMVNTYKNSAGWKDFEKIEVDPNSPIPPESVSIVGKPTAMLTGETIQLTAVILPEKATDKTVEWKSLTPDIATVDETGLVTAVAPGNAQIEVICNGNRTISMIANWICIAKEAEVNGIYYKFVYDEKNKITDAYVIKPVSGKYAGTVTLPDKVVNIIDFNFRGIDEAAFLDCTELTSISLPAGTQTIGNKAFDGCTALQTVTVNTINPPAFPGYAENSTEGNPFSSSTYQTCSLYVPKAGYQTYQNAPIWKNFKNIRAIGGDTFVEANVDGIKYAFYDFYKTAKVLKSADYTGEITVPDKVTYKNEEYNVVEIEDRAFAGTSIDILRLPASLKVIPDEMAADCKQLVCVGLPDHLETIGVKAFFGSTNIRFIRCYNFGADNNYVPPTFTPTAESDYGDAFSTEIWPDCMLVIPSSMYANYKKTVGWKNFRSFAYWHDYDVEPTAVEFPGQHQYQPGKSVTLTPVTAPGNATILNFVIKANTTGIASFSAGKDADNKTALIVNTLEEGETEVTVYVNLVKTTFTLKVDKTVGINSIISDQNTDVRYFNIQGVELKNPAPGTICIRVIGNKVEKIVFTAD